MTRMIRVLIAEDHTIVREGLQSLIDSEEGMEVIGEAKNGIEAIELARKLRPDVVLLDLLMPRMSGLEAIPTLKEDEPDIKILVLTSLSEDDKIFSAIEAGALGYLSKDTSSRALLQAIREVDKGELALPPLIARKMLQKILHPEEESVSKPLSESPLTAREMEVLRLLARGLTNQDIASELFVSERTIRNHVTAILGKLHLANRTQAALYAIREGIVSIDIK